MGTFFIADLHFGHKNILAFDNRPAKKTLYNVYTKRSEQ